MHAAVSRAAETVDARPRKVNASLTLSNQTAPPGAARRAGRARSVPSRTQRQQGRGRQKGDCMRGGCRYIARLA